jgi:formylglycine-generating enzyme required for sulfatase activity
LGSYSSSDPSGSNFKGKNMPTLQVSWDDCQGFVKALSKRERRKYRLPTEAEWEYACRAGTTTPFSFGDTLLPEQANYDCHFVYAGGKKARARRKTTPVGSFPPNAWGLYDMHGNVSEWCADWYGAYPSKPVKDPLGKTPNRWAPYRVLRGGCWHEGPARCRSARRDSNEPDSQALNHGVRVCWS